MYTFEVEVGTPALHFVVLLQFPTPPFQLSCAKAAGTTALRQTINVKKSRWLLALLSLPDKFVRMDSSWQFAMSPHAKTSNLRARNAVNVDEQKRLPRADKSRTSRAQGRCDPAETQQAMPNA